MKKANHLNTPIIHVSAECYPFAKIGGLPKYQSRQKTKSIVIMPLYDIETMNKLKLSTVHKAQIHLGAQTYDFQILTLKDNNLGFDVFFVDVQELLFKDYIYSFDDAERFMAFQIAALDWILTLNPPEAIHCHDHHTGLIPFMLQECYRYEALNRIPVVTTIHNAQYQGWFSDEKLSLIPDFDHDKVGLLYWHKDINPLAATIKCAWRVTTVSPSYMEELKTAANGLEDLLHYEREKCVGILNGIDTEVWNTETDSYLIKNYTQRTIVSGKKAHKKWLCKEFDLDETKPLFVFIGRLVWEKGAELLPEICEQALAHLDISILILGSGDEEVQNKLTALKSSHQGYYDSTIGYNEELAHRLYAGADFLLMPSRVEPCGLNQLYSLRYGTIPVVRRIGGLQDTVTDIGDDGFGILHQNTTVADVTHAITRSIALYNTKTAFNKIRKKIMTIDHSWDASAKQYLTLYKSLNQKL